MANNRELSQLGSIVTVDDSSKNLGIGTTNPNAIVGAGNTAKLSVGILSAYQLFGDGSNLTNLPAAGFLADAQENLYAGTSAGESSDADTCFNIGIGYSAGASLNSGDQNIFLGCCAGNSTTSGGHNVFLGSKAGANHTSGYYNIAIGNCANASGTTTGQYNVFVGCSAGDCVTSGCDNVYLGRGAGKCVTTARCNIALGFFAGSKNLSGLHNIFFGNNAGGNSSSGNSNINIGQRTGFCNAGGCYNNFIGHYAGYYNTTGCTNNYFGYAAGYSNTTGSANNIFGENAGFDLASGSNNVFIGNYSGKSQTSGDCNIAIGHNACLPNKTGSSQLAIGAGSTNWIAGDSSFNVTIAGIATVTASTGVVEATKFCGDGSCLTGLGAAGFQPDTQENLYAGTHAGAASDADTCFNIGIGYSAGSALNSGDNNILLGCEVGRSLTNGCYNIFLGLAAAKNTTSGTHNIVMGYLAGCSASSLGSGNVILGSSAARSMTGNCNIAIGCDANWLGCGGGCNIILGKAAGYKNCGNYNVFLGRYTGGYNRTGAYNVFLGCGTGSTNTTGDSNIAIGCQVSLPSATGDKQLAIGNGTDRWIAGDSSFNVTIANKLLVYTSGIVTASSGIVTYYGDGSNLTGITADQVGAIGSIVSDTTPQLGGDLDVNGNDIFGTGNVNLSGIVTATAFHTGAEGSAIRVTSNTISGPATLTIDPAAVGDNTGKVVIAGDLQIDGTTTTVNSTTMTVDDKNLELGTGAANDAAANGGGITIVSGEGNKTFQFEATGDNLGSSENLNIASGKDYKVNNVSVLNATTLGSSVVNSSLTSVGTLGSLTVSGISTFNNAINIEDGKDLYFRRSDANVADLFAGNPDGFYINILKGIFSLSSSTATGSGNIRFNAKSGATIANRINSTTRLEVNGSGIDVTGVATFSGDITANGNIVGDNSTNITGINQVTATTFSGALSGNATSATTATNVTVTANDNTDENVFLTFVDGQTGSQGIEADNNLFYNPNSNILYAGTFSGKATNIDVTANNGTNETVYPVFVDGATGSQGAETDTALSYNPSTDTLTAGTFSGALSGNGAAITALNASELSSGVVPAARMSGLYNIESATFTVTANNSTNETVYPVFVDGATGSQGAETDTGLSYNPSSGTLSATTYFGDGSNLTGITASGTGAIGGLTVKDEGSVVGTAGSVSTFDFVGSSVVVAATSGASGIATVTISSEFNADADLNLFASNTCSGCDLDGSSGCFNVFLGACAGKKVTSGNNNIFLGKCAGTCTQTGDGNIFIGECAGYKSCCFDNVIAIGKLAGKGMDFAQDNTILGACGGYNLNNGTCNVYIGKSAGFCNVSGQKNTAIGMCAGYKQTGYGNVFLGFEAGKCVGQDMCCSTLIGANAGYCATGKYNTFLGWKSGNGEELTGCCNVVIGYCATIPIKGGNSQLAIGSTSNNWIVGDSNFNVGIGQTIPTAVVGAGNTAVLAVGIVSAYQLYGDGSNLTGVGLSADADLNLFASNTCSGCNLDGTNGCFNVFLGWYAGKSVTSGDNNVFLGKCAGNSNNTGEYNLFFGKYAGKEFTGNSYGNIAIGCKAASEATGGNNNIFLGGYNVRNLSAGEDNIVMGTSAGDSLTTACRNIFIGCKAGQDATTAKHNVYVGTYAGKASATTCYNSFFGGFAGGEHSDGNYNFYGGYAAGGLKGAYNVAFGKYARREKCGDHNIAMGQCAAGKCTACNTHNITMGYFSAACITTGSNNIFLGQCTAATGPVTGNCNVVIGTNAGLALAQGSFNVAIGQQALKCNISQNSIVAIGNAAGLNATNAQTSIFIGAKAGACQGNGVKNLFLGYYAGKGSGTVSHNDGDCNTFIGHYAGNATCSGSKNTFLGYSAGCSNTQGCCNIFIGQQAGNTNTTGNKNIAIGWDVELPSATGDKQFAIGHEQGRWITGDSSFNVTVSTASTFSSSGINVVGVVTATDFNATSDARLKTNVQVISDPLDKIVRIDGVSFDWIENNKSSMGVIADNIEEVVPELVSDTDPKTVNYNGLIGLLIEVVKEQQTQIDSLNERLSRLE